MSALWRGETLGSATVGVQGMQSRLLLRMSASAYSLTLLVRLITPVQKATSCQEADWARHKSSCTSIQAQDEVSAERRTYAALRSWRKKHAPTVNMYAARAMNVLVDPSVGDRGVFAVLMRLRPAERRPELLFDVDDAFPLPFSELGQNRAEIEKLYEEEKRAMEGREEKMTGVVLVIYFVTNMNVSLATPHVFHAPARVDMSMLAWKEPLLEHLNTGNLNLQSEAIGEMPST